MIKSVSALLFGASLLTAAPASAAGFLVYTLTATGTVTYNQPSTATDPQIYYTAPLTGNFIFVLPESAVATGSYVMNPFPSDPSVRRDSAYAGSSTLTFTGLNAASDRFGSLSANISVCGTFGGVFPTASQAVDPTCSPASADVSVYPYGRSQFTGAITNITVRREDGTPDRFGFVQAPGVPEPATWAMMIAGFALVGASMRRRTSLQPHVA